MTHLTKAIRENMRDVVLDHAFEEKTAAAKAELIAAGDALYMSHHGEHLKTMQKLPPEFLYRASVMNANIGGQTHKVNLSEIKLLSRESVNSKIPFATDNTAAIAYLQANDKVNDIKSQRATMSNKVNAILESVRTFKKLWEAWPEAKPLLEHFEEKPPATYLPAIQFDQINAELGLPPAATGFPWSHRLTASGTYEIGHFGPAGFVKNQEAKTLAEAKYIVEKHNEKLGV